MAKTILITGSSDGIGKLAAIQLAKEGHQIIIQGTKADKLTNIFEAINQVNANASVHSIIADFSEFENINTFIEEVKNNYPKIEVLINNAGLFKSAQLKNSNGLDLRFMINYFAPYLITNALLPNLKQSENPKVINLSSAAQAPVSLNALNGNAELSNQESYAQSKLALTMWNNYFAAKHLGLTSIALNPGSLLNTRMVREAFGRHWSPAEKGSDIIYELVLADNKEMSGKYFDNDQGNYGMAHPDAYDQEKTQKLIDATEAILQAHLK